MVGTPLSRDSALDSIDLPERELRPLWTIENFEDEEDVLKWTKTAVSTCEAYYQNIFQVQMDNLLIFKGVQWLNQDKYSNRFLDRNRVVTRRSPKVVINHIYDFTEQWVSRLTRFRPAVAIFPTNTEYQDQIDAETAKDVLDHIWYNSNIDWYLQEFCRQAKIFGEAYMFVTWNPNKGDLHPDYVKARQMGGRVPVKNPETGEPVNSEDGTPLMIDRAVRVGDIEYGIDAPWHVFDMPCRNRDNIDWCIRWRTVDLDYLKAKYPEKSGELKHDSTAEVFSNYRLDIGKLKNEVIEYELWHRHSEFLDKGRYLKFTRNCILENTDLPYSHGKLPYIRLTDIDVPDQIRGMSFIQQLFPLQHQINACASLIYKSLVLMAHPKIVMPDGACNIEQLTNESTIVSYQGGVPPTLMQNNPVSQQLFQYLDKLEQTAEKLSGIFTMSRGQAPSGVRAAKALRVLEEQEDKRAYITNIKYNQNGLVENAKLSLATAGDYYDDSDGRLARIVGKDNEYRIRQFKSANLSKPYDIRIENTTALSQSPAAMLEELNEIATLELPPNGLLTKEQYIAYTGLGRSKEFKDFVTRAVKAAESENDDLISGMPVAEPTPDEDLIVHLRQHYNVPQRREFKEGVYPPQVVAGVKRHILLTEILAHQKAFGVISPVGQLIKAPNQGFAQQLLMALPNFPVYYDMPPAPAPMPMGLGGGGMPPQGGGMPSPVLQPEPLDAGGSVVPPGPSTVPGPLM